MKFRPRKFQMVAIDHGVDFFRNAKTGDKRGYAAPTGSGKSVIEIGVQEQLQDVWIVTPREEIAYGMLDKLEVPESDWSVEAMLANHIVTPMRLYNMLMAGKIEPPKGLIYDEGHHHEAETWQRLDLLCGLCPAVYYTASPYRGSPRSTKQFREAWGEPIWLIHFDEACAEGFISKPSFETLPLVDDDIVEVSSTGEFDVTSLEAATVDRLGDLARIASERWYSGGEWDRPTIFSMPSSSCCIRFQQEMAKFGVPSFVVSAETSRDVRQQAFKATEARIAALLHINIVTEGVDLKLRRLVDASPTMSPVKWVQQFGRITRPVGEGELPPEYVCTNRNVLRHAYALEGAVPVSAVVDAEKAFPKAERAHARALGMEAIGRFKPAPVKLKNGCTAHVYSLSCVLKDGTVGEYCALVPPTDEPIWAMKVNTIEDGVRKYGSWIPCPAPEGVQGFNSVPAKPPSPKQLAWWKRSAAYVGLEAEQEVNRKNFQAMPMLFDTGRRLA